MQEPYNIQNDFFKTISDDKLIKNEHVEIYQDLVYSRIIEVVKSTFPIYCDYLSADELDIQVKAFIKYGSKTVYVWRIIFEFVEFLQNEYKVNTISNQILIFEKEQIRIYVSNKDVKSKKLNKNRRYRLSSNAFIQKHNFDIVNRSFESIKEEYYLVYKNQDDYDVYYINISKFLFLFLKNLRSFHTLDKALKLASKQSNIKYNDAKEISSNVIENFVNTAVMV